MCLLKPKIIAKHKWIIHMSKCPLILILLLIVVSCGFQTITTYGSANSPSVASEPSDGQLIDIVGTVVYNDLEGGFWGVITDAGVQYEPMVLQDEFKKNGLKIRFSGVAIKDAGSIYMWGTPIEIRQIVRVY
jgi:hypothetical protein